MAASSLLVPQTRSQWWRVLLLLVAVRMLAAWFSVGYYHADEHFQILEFATYKMGHRTPTHLPWEFHEQMRPGLQPWMVVQVWRGLDALGWATPGNVTGVLRGLTGLVGAVLLWLLWRVAGQWVGTAGGRWWLGLLVLVPWFLVYQHVRFSSETWGGFGLLAGYLLLLWPRTKYGAGGQRAGLLQALAAGVCLGLAFQFRYQTAFFTIGLLLGLLMPWAGERRIGLARLGAVALGGALTLGLGALADAWLYGSWQFPPYNYLIQNIVENRAAQFGTHPVWFYPWVLVEKSYGPWGLLFVVASVWVLVKQWRNPLVWGVWLFILGHTAVGHKEFRFLWPLVPFTPLLVVLAWESISDARQVRLSALASNRWVRVVGILVLTHNFGMMLVTSTMPGKSDVWVMEQVAARWGGQRIHLLEGSSDFLYRRAGFHEYAFYTPRNLVWVGPDSLSAIAAQSQATGQLPQPLLLCIGRKGLAPPDTNLGWCQCHLEVQYYPQWFSAVNVNGWLDRTSHYVVYECHENPSQP